MQQRIEVLGLNGWQAHQPQCAIRIHFWSEIAAAINRNVVSHGSNMSADLFVVSFNAAVFGNHSPAAYESHAHLRFRS